jgi:hypothetical protein
MVVLHNLMKDSFIVYDGPFVANVARGQGAMQQV